MSEIDAIKADFRNHVYLVWKHLGLPDPTPIQYDICDFLQGNEKRICIQAFRGVGKSWITSAYVLWLLLKNPQLNILVISASKQRADDFSTFCARLIEEVPYLAHLKPHPDQRSSKVAFDVGPAKASHAPSVKSMGITGQITGSRADVIIADDVEVVGNSMTQLLRDRLSEAVREFDAILKPKSPYGKIVYLGTPQTEESLYNQLPERGFQTRVWPARYPALEKLVAYEGKLAPIIEEKLTASTDGLGGPVSALETKLGSEVGLDAEGVTEAPRGLPGDWVGLPTDPARFDDHELTERELSYGRSGFALQFQLDTSLSDEERYPLRLADLIVMDVDAKMAPEKVLWSKSPDKCIRSLQSVGLKGDAYYEPGGTSGDFLAYQGCVMAIDPSGRGADETTYAVVKMLNGQLFLVDVGGFLGGFEEDTLVALSKVAKRHSVNEVVIESNFGDGMFAQLLKPVMAQYHSCAFEEVRHNTRKEMRIIDTLEPVMNQHLLVVDRQVIEKDLRTNRPDLSPSENLSYRLFYQMTRLTKEKDCLRHDDRLDALSMAVGYWVEQMGWDRDQAIEARRTEVLERAIQESILKFDEGSDNWLGDVADW